MKRIFGLLAGCGFVLSILSVVALGDTFGSDWPYAMLPLPLVCVGIYLLVKRDRVALSPQGQAAKEALANAALQPESEGAAIPLTTKIESVNAPSADDWPFNERWWIRYLIALGFFGLGYYFIFEMQAKLGWIMGALCWFGAAGLMREIFLVALAAGALVLGAWAIAAGVAALPVSAAVIIGALIIAAAVKSR